MQGVFAQKLGVEMSGAKKKTVADLAAEPVTPSKRTIKDLLAERLAARSKPELHQHSAPLGYKLRGASTLLDADGNVRAQWIKTAVDHDDPALLLECFQEIAEERIRPADPLPMGNSDFAKDILAVVPYGDPHIGMLAWHMETGEDFDLKIARNLMTSAARKLLGLTPPCEQCLVVSVGDTIHIDNMENTTARGTRQDVDSRLPKVMRIGLETFIEIIDAALLRHKTVKVIIVPGNHDPATSLYLSTMLALYYRNEPRVEVDQSITAHRWHQFGKVALGVSHGEMVKLGDLPQLMATDAPGMWGSTSFRHIYSGHIHHVHVKELMGCTVESLRTLAGKDNYHAGHGYRAGRGVFADVWHREHGHRVRHYVGVEELRSA